MLLRVTFSSVNGVFTLKYLNKKLSGKESDQTQSSIRLSLYKDSKPFKKRFRRSTNPFSPEIFQTKEHTNSPFVLLFYSLSLG